jgi:hypothetical protein
VFGRLKSSIPNTDTYTALIVTQPSDPRPALETLDLQAGHDTTILSSGSNLGSWAENLQALIVSSIAVHYASWSLTDSEQRPSTYELKTCLSRKEVREHGPDDFFQMIVRSLTYHRTHELTTPPKVLRFHSLP